MKNILIVVVVIAIAIAIGIAGYFFTSKSSIFKNDSNKNPGAINTPDNTVPSNSSVSNANGTKLSLANKGLTKAPDYIFSQTNLVELDLSGNAIGGALQSQVGNLKKLKVLNLSNNNFTGVPAEVGQLASLEILNLSNNQITGLPNELANLSNLKLLDLSGNNYSETDLAKIKQSLPSSTVIKIK